MLLAKIDSFEKVVGPLDDKMGSELDVAPKGQDALDELYESMVEKERLDTMMAKKKRKARRLLEKATPTPSEKP